MMLLAIDREAYASPYDQAYAIITSGTAPSADPDLRPVIVNRVDGVRSAEWIDECQKQFRTSQGK
jgi:hypothetical protein